MQLSDCHVHLDSYEEAQCDNLIRKAEAAGVEIMVAVSRNAESSAITLGISQRHKSVLPAVGIHPWSALLFNEQNFEIIKRFASDKKVVAIGEMGLDFVRNPETKDLQLQSFEQQVKLAKETGLPINMHCKQADREALAILKKLKLPKPIGIAHGFAGDRTLLADWLGIGFYISLGTAVTTASEDFKEVIRAIPVDRLLLETDSIVGRTQRENLVPATVYIVAEKVAEIRGVPIEALAKATTLNLKHLLKVGG